MAQKADKAREGKRALFFLEIVLRTVKIKSPRYDDFLDKIAAYSGNLEHKLFKRFGEEFKGFRV